MATYAYLRVSTVRQAENGESLEVQERTIYGCAAMLGRSVDKIFVETGVSGSVPLDERPQGKALLDIVRNGDVIISTKLDRMFRSALDALRVLDDLKTKKVSLHLIDLGGDVCGNGISRLVFTILSAVAEAERDRIRERIAEVKADQKARGRFLGGIRPFGYQVAEDGSLMLDEAEQRAIAKARTMRDAGLSLRKIATALEADGFKLSHMGVKIVLDTPLRPIPQHS